MCNRAAVRWRARLFLIRLETDESRPRTLFSLASRLIPLLACRTADSTRSSRRMPVVIFPDLNRELTFGTPRRRCSSFVDSSRAANLYSLFLTTSGHCCVQDVTVLCLCVLVDVRTAVKEH